MSGPVPAWAPTHAQVTVLRARGLRPKAAAGGSDAYAVMALGRQKFSTSVAERCQGQPLWREEATFELPPRPAALRLTVLHRALVGIDKFLGRAEVELEALRGEGGRRHSRWYKLRSKPGKKEKERGEIEVDIQFMRSNMTASMFDLSMKDKPRSPFGKLKDKLKGKRSSALSDTASEIIPSTTHSPADSEDEAVEKEKKKSKFKALFSKPGLQKNSLSQSMSVLPTQQPVTQRVRLRPSDFQSQWDDEESEASPTSEKTFGNAVEEKSSPSPIFKSRKTVTLDSRQLNQVTTSHTKKEGLSLFSGLRSKSDPVSKSSLCINGSHVYMEESTTKDGTPASSPSPHNFRRKQLFASEENLSSRSTKGPEEVGRTSPSHALSGSASLETFKSMNLPSYKLLSSEEHLETSVPPSIEIIRETKKVEHKKPALLSLVTGKKDMMKSSDAENIPDRTLQGEESKAPEEKSEHEPKHLELPADSSTGNPSEENHRAGGVLASKQPLNPFEEEQKPEKAAAPAKTKAVKPRLGVTSEEETKATLPTLAPDSLPAFLPVQRRDNNPFISKTEQEVQVPGLENVTGSAPPPSPPFAAERWSGRNPFSPTWGGTATAPHPEDTSHSLSPWHLPASLPKVPLPGQAPGSAHNPSASAWGQSSWGQDPSQGPSGTPAPSPSGCHFSDNNPFVSKAGWEPEVPGLGAVAGALKATSGAHTPSPPCLPCDAEHPSAEHPAELNRSAPGASGVVLTGGALPASPALAPGKQRGSPQLQVEASLQNSKLGSGKPVSLLRDGSEGLQSGGERSGGQEGEVPPGGSARATSGAHTSSPREGAVLGAGGEVPVTPEPAPQLRWCPVLSQPGELSGGVSSSGRGAKPVPALPLPDAKVSGARGCLPPSGSLEPVTAPVTLGDNSSDRQLGTEGGSDLFGCFTDLKPSIALCGDRGSKLAGLPAIPEGGSDEELLGDGQESWAVTAGDTKGSEAGEQSREVMSLCEELKEHSHGSAAAQASLAAPGGGGGGGGRGAGACQPSSPPVLPAGGDGGSVHGQAAGSATVSRPRERSGHFEKRELNISAGVEERAECDLSEPSVSSSSLSRPSQPRSSSPSLPSDAPSRRAESPKKPAAEGSADKAGNSGKRKLLQAWVSPSETYPSQTQQGGETVSPKHRLHPVKPMNATASKPQSKNLNVISTMNEKLLEMNVKKYDPSDPAYAYAQLTHDELIQLVLKQKDAITKRDLQVRELEDYIDNLLVRVMEETPNILRVSMSGNKKAGKM